METVTTHPNPYQPPSEQLAELWQRQQRIAALTNPEERISAQVVLLLDIAKHRKEFAAFYQS